MDKALLVVATSLSVIGTVDYILSILNGKTLPHKTTRVVLFIVSIANLLGTLTADAGIGILLLALFFFGRSLVLALMSLKWGVGGTSKLDITCAIIAILGIVAWQVTDNGILTLVFAILADAVAYIPAVVKTWKLPKSEAPLMYWLEGIAVTLVIIHDGVRLNIIFQAYILLSCIVMLVCIYRPTFGKDVIST